MNKNVEIIYKTMRRKSHGLLFDLAEVCKEFPQYSAQKLSAYLMEMKREGLLKNVVKNGVNVYKIT
jgi:hypothetical protein